MTQTPEENEWQPVRIIGGFSGHQATGAPIAKLSKPVKANNGRIVRARVTQERSGYTCDGQILECHPDDAKKILGVVGSESCRFCEHQIQAD